MELDCHEDLVMNYRTDATMSELYAGGREEICLVYLRSARVVLHCTIEGVEAQMDDSCD